jgi:hypothetical protein
VNFTLQRSEVQKSSTVKRVIRTTLHFHFYFELKETSDKSRLPQLLAKYSKIIKKYLHSNCTISTRLEIFSYELTEKARHGKKIAFLLLKRKKIFFP